MEEANGDRVTWSYDDTSQLTSERRSGATSYNHTYVYDAVGNSLIFNDNGSRTSTVYDAANQIEYIASVAGRTTYAFDANGNQPIVEQVSGERTTYTWDYENRGSVIKLPSDIRNTMTYQPDGLRVELEELVDTKKFLWDGDTYLIESDANDISQVVYSNVPETFGNLVSHQQFH